MYGFKPRHAQGEPVQNLADGGLVHSITGMLGMRKKTPEEMLAADAKVQERNREAADRVAARAKPAQPAAPAEEKAVSNYAGMSALQRREKELGLKDGGTVGGFKPGGLIRGPGTGTSDSIKTEKRPGTFIMPADSTQAIGPEALEELGESEEMGEEAEGMEGRSSAGDDDAVPVALSNGEFEFTPEQVQALGEAVLTVMRDATHKAVGEGSGKMRAAGFAPAQAFSGGGSVRDPEELRKMIPQVEAMGYKQAPAVTPAPAAPAPAPAAPAAAPAPAAPSEYSRQMGAVGGALADGAAWLGKTIVSAPGYGFSKPSAAPAQAVATATAGAGRGSINPASVNPTQPAAAATEQTNAATDTAAAPTQPPTNEVMPGVYRHGRGQYSDNAAGMGMPAGFTGQPSAQNMAAADALAARQTPAGFQPAGSPQASVQAPIVRNSTNDWAARKALENAATAASSITANGGRFDRNGRAGSPQAAAYRAALANDFALQQAQPGMEQAAMRENAANQRVAMQEQGSTNREAGRNALTADELGLKREAAGFQTRAAKRLESAYDNYSKAKTDEDRQAIAKQFPDLFGQAKDAAHRMEVVRGKTDPMTGQSSGDYVVVQDPKTGEVRQIQMGAAPAPQAMPKPASKAEFDALPKGTRFTDPNGQVRIK